MNDDEDLAVVARSIIDDSLYMTLGTADGNGLPWVSPVYFATADYAEFYWISRPEARHSGNLGQRRRLSIVIFDSRVPVFTGQAVYMSATAEEVAGPELDRGLEIYPGRAERGVSALAREDVRPPAAYRLYRATVSEHFVICPRDTGEPCRRHGIAADHRTVVTPRRR